MPLSEYDDVFGDAAKAMRNFKRTYGDKDGEHVFFAKVAKERRRSQKPKAAKSKPPPFAKKRKRSLAERLLG